MCVVNEPEPLDSNVENPDQPEMVVDQAPKVVLQNRLAKCRAKLGELKPTMDSKRKRLQQRLSRNIVTSLHDLLERNVGQLENILTPQNFGDVEDVAFVLLPLFSLVPGAEAHSTLIEFHRFSA